MLRNFIALAILVVFSAPALGSDSPSMIKEISFNLGAHTEFYNAIQNDASGGLRKFDLAPTIGAGLVIPMSESWAFLPELNWVLPQTIENSHIMINTFMLRGDISYDPLEWLRLRLGTSLMWQNQQGRGGQTQMNNGNSTSRFYYPDENRSSLNNTLDAAFETLFDQYSIRFQTYTYSVFKEQQRQISYTLFLTYYWEK